MSDPRFKVKKDHSGAAWVSLDSLHDVLDAICKRADSIPLGDHEKFTRMVNTPGVLIRAVIDAMKERLPKDWATDPRRKQVSLVTFQNGEKVTATARRRRVIQGPESGNTATTQED